ncbi:hypothetical protein ABT270_40235, partial [Streptomyces sp900105245]
WPGWRPVISVPSGAYTRFVRFPTEPTVGQQWFVLPDASANGAYRLVNRYSGLVLGLSARPGRLAETTPARNWTDRSGSSVGAGRTAAEQRLTLVPAGR